MAKNTIIVYTDWMEQLQELSMEERGIILTAAINYQLGLELPKMDKSLKLFFITIRQSIDRDNAAYIIKCEKNRENGKLGGAPKGNQNAKKTTETSERLNEELKQPKQPDNDNDNVNDNDNDNENDKDNDNDSGGGGLEPPQPPLSELDAFRIAQAWNEQICTQHISGLTKTRRKKVQECGDINLLVDTISDLDQQHYLVKQAKAGKAVTFDWFIQPDNYRKVLEGNYRETFGGGGTGGKLARNW